MKIFLITVFCSITIIFISCNLSQDNVQGEYRHKDLGEKYTIILDRGKLIQRLILNNDTFFHSCEYSISDVVILYDWKEMEDIPDVGKGGCNGCELVLDNDKLLFYADPDDSPKEIFVKY